jgi:uncharacterized protein
MSPDFEGARQYALHRLETQLPPILYYHSLQHTRDDVVIAVERLAPMEGIYDEALMLLRTAAYFHDVGFTVQVKEHEFVSAEIAGEVLPGLKYGTDQVTLIQRLIRVTKLPQKPKSLMENIIVDADMDSLGRDDFMNRSLALRAELAALGNYQTDLKWYEGQVHFLSSHRYFTASARALRDGNKARHIQELLILIHSNHSSTQNL